MANNESLSSDATVLQSSDRPPSKSHSTLDIADEFYYPELELHTPVLDELCPYLYLFARKEGCHIDTLNQHRTRGRQIIATEEMHLHLVWENDRIFVKRMPESLLGRGMRTNHWSPGASTDRGGIPISRDPKAVLGFLRSYAFLIQYPLDFILAQESFLLPKTMEWEHWAEFIAQFRQKADTDVANRYQYGQLRLSRLNWAVRIFNPSSSSTRWFYAIPQWSILKYLEIASVPLLFLFAIISLVLSAMQVILSIDVSILGLSESIDTIIGKGFFIFSLVIIIISAIIWGLILVIPLCVLAWQLKWGYNQHSKEKKQQYSI